MSDRYALFIKNSNGNSKFSDAGVDYLTFNTISKNHIVLSGYDRVLIQKDPGGQHPGWSYNDENFIRLIRAHMYHRGDPKFLDPDEFDRIYELLIE